MELSNVLGKLDKIVAKNFVNTRGEPVKLARYQNEIVKTILKREKSRILVLASTRVGKTESAVVASILAALIYPGEEVVVVAPRYEQAMGIFKRIRNNFWSNPDLLNMVDLTRGFRAQEIVLKNGSTLRFLNAGGKESLLSWGATFLIVDEFASISPEVLRTRVLRLTGGSGERRPITVLLGTPHNFDAVADWVYDSDVRVFTITWKDGVEAGILNPQEVEYFKKKMSDEEFEIWFEAKLRSPTDAFFN
ncbi:MAG: DEAD/DEAH box helicase family protein, partial [Candidatus Hadarchaeales archaeon]